MSLNLQTIMVGCEFTYQIWTKLHVYFASQTRAKVSQLKIQLKNIKKTRGINDYLLSIKKIVDTLTTLDSPIDTVEHIEIILDGLPNEYDPIVTSIVSRTNAYIVPEIEYLLMNIKGRIEKQKYQDSNSTSYDKIMVAETTQNDASSTFTTLMAVPKTLYDPTWYTNPGATNHLILQDINLMRATSYNVNHIGSSFFYSPNLIKPLFLNDLMHVSTISKNLLSVSQFVKDNKCVMFVNVITILVG
ncbi:hypothetical protein CR513_58882, partial [Mucuna pruriens]